MLHIYTRPPNVFISSLFYHRGGQGHKRVVMILDSSRFISIHLDDSRFISIHLDSSRLSILDSRSLVLDSRFLDPPFLDSLSSILDS